MASTEEFLKQAAQKREQAEHIRSIARSISHETDRAKIMAQVEALEAEAARLEATASRAGTTP